DEDAFEKRCLGFRFVAQELVATEAYAFGERLGCGAPIDAGHDRVEDRRRDRGDPRRVPGEHGAGPPERGGIEGLLVADTEEERGTRAQPAAGRYCEHLAPRAVEVGLLHELTERAADRIIDESRARSESRPREHRYDEQVGVGRARNELERGHHDGSLPFTRGAKVAFLPTRERVDEVGEAIEIRHDLTLAAEPAGARRGDRHALRAPDHGAGEVERGGDRVLTREHELSGRFEPPGHVVDDRLEPRHHVGGDERHLGLQLAAILRCGRELGADDEQLALQLHEQLVQLRIGIDLGPRQAQRAHGLVDGSVRLGPDVVLADPTSVQETGGSVVAGARIVLHVEAAAYDPALAETGRDLAQSPRNLERWPIPEESHRRSAVAPCTPSSTRSTSACSCSTARSAPGCRLRTSARTISAARRWRVATSSSSPAGPISSPGCTTSSSRWGATVSRQPPSAPSRSCSTSTDSPDRPSS